MAIQAKTFFHQNDLDDDDDDVDAVTPSSDARSYKRRSVPSPLGRSFFLSFSLNGKKKHIEDSRALTQIMNNTQEMKHLFTFSVCRSQFVHEIHLLLRHDIEKGREEWSTPESVRCRWQQQLC